MDLVRRQLIGYGGLALTGASLGAAGSLWLSSQNDDYRLLPSPAPAIPHPAASIPAPPVTTAPAAVTRRPPATPGVSVKRVAADARRAFVRNIHTGETLDAIYFANGAYAPVVMAEAMRVLRDWRNGQEHVMHPGLFDLLHRLGETLSIRNAFQIISGYRSPATNAMLHTESHEVASHSQHLLGKALDIRVDGVALARLHKAALSLRAGGVGFYPQSDFVHVDVGPVRQWSGT